MRSDAAAAADDDDDDVVVVDDVLNSAKRAAAKNLKCPGKKKIKIVGLVPLNAKGRPASPSARACPYLTSLLPTVQGKCNDRQQCKLSPKDIAVSKKQCPGVGSVNFRVKCIKKGIGFNGPLYDRRQRG